MTKKEIIKELGKPKISEMMDENKYWSIIQESIENSNNQDEQTDCLFEKLIDLNLKEIISFYNRTEAFLYKLNNKKMRCASVVINYDILDDSFLFFRAWIIMLGKEKYNEVCKNPDCLVKYVKNVNSLDYLHEFESLTYMPHVVFDIRTHKGIEKYVGYKGNDFVRTIDVKWLFEGANEIVTFCPELYKMYEKTNLKRRQKSKVL